MKTIAALYVQEDGCYPKIDYVDAWGVSRDARNYKGNLPVIAHPPCQLWGAMAKVNFSRWGGEHNRPGNDGGCFESALANVRRCGGVLEHPAKTYAFERFGITRPLGIGWSRANCGGWVCEVWQSAYGHLANKATWIYYYGGMPPMDLRWERPRGSHQIGYPDKRGKNRNKPTLSKKLANATPVEFMNVLLELAHMSKLRYE